MQSVAQTVFARKSQMSKRCNIIPIFDKRVYRHAADNAIRNVASDFNWSAIPFVPMTQVFVPLDVNRANSSCRALHTWQYNAIGLARLLPQCSLRYRDRTRPETKATYLSSGNVTSSRRGMRLRDEKTRYFYRAAIIFRNNIRLFPVAFFRSSPYRIYRKFA